MTYQPKTYRKDGGDTFVVAIGGAIHDERNIATIYVDQNGSDTLGDGSIFSPFATLAKALTLVTAARKNIMIMSPGDYVEAASITWPNINGVHIIGPDKSGSTVISGPITTPVITIDPTYTAESFEAFLENINIKHTAQTGLEIDNTNMTRKLLVHLDNVSFEAVSSGDSINVTHTTAGQAIRLFAAGCDEIEGLVHVVVANADDRFRFMDGCVLIGGLTTAGAVAGEVSLVHSVVLAGAFTIGSETQVVSAIHSCYRTDAGVFSAMTDRYSD